KPKAEKKPIEAFTDVAKAGPDFAIQGEYVAEHNGNKVGVQVIAEGDGAFHVKGYKGGLPGDGWDGQGIKEGKAKTENGKVTIKVENVTESIGDGQIIAKNDDGEVVGNKVTRKSPTEGMKPPEGAVVLFDGTNLDGWNKMDRKSPATWTLLEGGVM